MKFRVGPASTGPEVAGAISGRTFSGFGTTIGSWTTNPELVDHVDGFMRNWVATVEAACSRFLPDSDISRANDAAGGAVLVNQTLLNATEAAMAMADLTNGLCDPTLGEAVINAGYDRTFSAIEADGPGPKGPSKLGGAWPQLLVDHEASTITVPAGHRLDLGGSAKGWAVDAALAALSRSVLDQAPRAGIRISAGRRPRQCAGRALQVDGRSQSGSGWTSTPAIPAPKSFGTTARSPPAAPRRGVGKTAAPWATTSSTLAQASRVAAAGSWSPSSATAASSPMSPPPPHGCWAATPGDSSRTWAWPPAWVDHDGSIVTVGNLGGWLTGAILA